MNTENFTEHLQGILDETRSGTYIGGSLDLGNAWLNTDGKAHWSENGVKKTRDLTVKETLLLCKIYVENKNSQHAFYDHCISFIENNREY